MWSFFILFYFILTMEQKINEEYQMATDKKRFVQDVAGFLLPAGKLSVLLKQHSDIDLSQVTSIKEFVMHNTSQKYLCTFLNKNFK